jgi:hypothetical protein
MLKTCRFLFLPLGLVLVFSITAGLAQEDLLDGKIFVGQSREKHKRTVNEDEIRFLNGTFHSISYGQKGFNVGVYTARAEEDKIYFEADTVSQKNGKIQWDGIVNGDSIKMNFRWRKKGWLSDTERHYTFIGTLKIKSKN